MTLQDFVAKNLIKTTIGEKTAQERQPGGFSLIELLVVIGIIALLLALGLPVTRLARQHAAEVVCRSNLRQMATILKTYCNDHDSLFPDPSYIYHSRKSLDPNKPVIYRMGCRWHDARIGPGSVLLGNQKDLQGVLTPYLGDPKILVCKVGARANSERGCCNMSPVITDVKIRTGGSRREVRITATAIGHEDIPIIPQYTYTMNGNLYRRFQTANLMEASTLELDQRTVREWQVRGETHVTRSPSEVFVFGEENSWTVSDAGRYNLSGRWPGRMDHGRDTTDPFLANYEFTGTLTLGGLDIGPSYVLTQNQNRFYAKKVSDTVAGDAFATYHRPRGGDWNTGHSYVSMLDGHVRKVTVSDQLRKSQPVEDLPESPLGPGGNLHLAWPLDVPPLVGWENQ